MNSENNPEQTPNNQIVEETEHNQVETNTSIQQLVKDITRIGLVEQTKPDPNKLTSGIELKDDHGRILNNMPTLIYNHQSTFRLTRDQVSNRVWEHMPLRYSEDSGAQRRAPQLRVWRPIKEGDIRASFRKYDVRFKLPRISAEEFRTLEEFDRKSNNNWSRGETEYLFDLLQLFHGNFILVHDRFDERLHGNKRSVEDLKERVYFVMKLSKAAGMESMDVYYEKENEEIRKLSTERYMLRNSMVNKKEEDLLKLIKDTNVKINKKEKEEDGIRNMLDLTCGQDFDDILGHDSATLPPVEKILEDLDQKQKNRPGNAPEQHLAFNRSSLMTLTVPGVSAILNAKLNTSLTKMALNAQTVANEENHDLLDRLKKEFIRLFVLKAYYEKKANELENLKSIEKSKANLLNKRGAI